MMANTSTLALDSSRRSNTFMPAARVETDVKKPPTASWSLEPRARMFGRFMLVDRKNTYCSNRLKIRMNVSATCAGGAQNTFDCKFWPPHRLLGVEKGRRAASRVVEHERDGPVFWAQVREGAKDCAQRDRQPGVASDDHDAHQQQRGGPVKQRHVVVVQEREAHVVEGGDGGKRRKPKVVDPPLHNRGNRPLCVAASDERSQRARNAHKP